AHTSGAHHAMGHLLGLGHRRIAAITGPRGWVATEDRRRGYHAALASAGILPRPELEAEADFEIGGGVEAAGRLLDRAEPPTAAAGRRPRAARGATAGSRLIRRLERQRSGPLRVELAPRLVVRESTAPPRVP